MRTSPLPVFALGAILAAALPAPAQTGSVRVNAPPTPIPPPEHLTLRATSPSTFSAVCTPPVHVSFEGVVTAEVAILPKYFKVKLIWSDAVVSDVERDSTLSPDRKTLTVKGSRSFDKSFDGWALLQFQRTENLRVRNSDPPIAVKITCEPPHLTTGAPKVPPPSAGPGH